MAKTRNYKEHLHERLKKPKEAAEYLSAAIDDDDPGVFLIALKDVTDAYGRMNKLSMQSSLNRQSLYKALSKSGNPKLLSILAILSALGMEISIKPASKKSNFQKC